MADSPQTNGFDRNCPSIYRREILQIRSYLYLLRKEQRYLKMQKKKYTERVVEAEQMEFITYLEYSLNEI